MEHYRDLYELDIDEAREPELGYRERHGSMKL